LGNIIYRNWCWDFDGAYNRGVVRIDVIIWIYYIGSSVGLIGAIFNVFYSRWGFLMFLFANIILLIQGINLHQWNVLINYIPYSITSLVGFYLWSRPEREDRIKGVIYEWKKNLMEKLVSLRDVIIN
jgi:hypothetical protein